MHGLQRKYKKYIILPSADSNEIFHNYTNILSNFKKVKDNSKWNYNPLF